MNLPDHLFWDIDLETLDYTKHARFIIQRVAQRGSLQDWKNVREYYGDEKIKEDLLQARSLDKKTLNFYSSLYNIPKCHFRCCTTLPSKM